MNVGDIYRIYRKVGDHLEAAEQTEAARRLGDLREKLRFDNVTGSILGTLIGHTVDYGGGSRENVLEFVGLIYDFCAAAKNAIE